MHGIYYHQNGSFGFLNIFKLTILNFQKINVNLLYISQRYGHFFSVIDAKIIPDPYLSNIHEFETFFFFYQSLKTIFINEVSKRKGF